MTVLELRELAATKAEEAAAIKAKCEQEERGLATDEDRRITDLLNEAERLEHEANQQERLENVQARFQAAKDPESRPVITTGEKIHTVPATAMRFGELRAFKGPDAERNAYWSGMWLLATIGSRADIREKCQRQKGFEVRVQTESDNTAGGFLVPDETENSIIDLREEYGNARREARLQPMTSDHMIIPRRSDGLTAYFVGETSEITASDKSWGHVELTAKKLGVLTRMSSDLNEDAVINIADDFIDEMALTFATKEDQCAIDGDGTGTYGGMIGIRTKAIDGSHSYAYHDFSSSMDQWSEVTDTALMELMSKLPLYGRRRAKWHCSPQAKVACFDRLIQAAGGATMRERVDGVYKPAYMGYPIVEWPAMPTDDTSAALNNKIMFFFGDYKLAATLGSRRGITIKRSEDRYLEYDQIGIRATQRFCIVNHNIGTDSAYGPVICAMGGS